MPTTKGAVRQSSSGQERRLPFLCPADDTPCEVLEPLADGVLAQVRSSDVPMIIERAQPHLPCHRCRFPEVAAQNLPAMRLGKHERNILRNAAGPDAVSGAVIDPDMSTHSEREANLRAVRKLTRAGLLRVGRSRVRVQTAGIRRDGAAIKRTYLMRTVWQTPFGAEIAHCYAVEIASGRAIRWARHTQNAVQAVRLRGDTLLSFFRDHLRRVVQTSRPSTNAPHAQVVLRTEGTKLDPLMVVLTAITGYEKRHHSA